VRAQQIGQLAQHAQHLALLVGLGGAQRVAELDHLGRLDKRSGPGRRLVVHDPADPRARGRADRDHVAAAPQRDGCVGGAVGRIQRGEHRLQLRHESLARFPHAAARAGERARRRVEQHSLGVHGGSEALLELLGRRVDPQRGRAGGIAGEPSQLRRGDAAGGERPGERRELEAFERAAGHRQQLERRRDVGDGLGANGVVVEQQRGELGDLRQRRPDHLGVAGRSAGTHPCGAEWPGGVRRHPLERGREFQCVQHGGGDPSRDAHTLAASSSRAI